jgi:DNA-binding CsgD family transcriptional regulator
MKVYDVTVVMGFDICDSEGDNHIRLRLRVVRLGNEPKFTELDRQRLSSIIPLMKKSLTIYSRMEIRGISQEIYQELLASMDIASFILGANFEVMAKNYLAEQVVKNKDGLFTDHKKLRCINPVDQQKLTEVCQNILNLRSRDDSAFLLENFELGRARPGANWSALIRPVNSQDFMGAENNPELLLLIRDSSRRQIPTPTLLIDVFGVTPAEARLTLQLIDGLSLTAAAEALGISRNTARTQLSSVFRKTKLHSQTQLVKLVSDTLSNHWL